MLKCLEEEAGDNKQQNQHSNDLEFYLRPAEIDDLVTDIPLYLLLLDLGGTNLLYLLITLKQGQKLRFRPDEVGQALSAGDLVLGLLHTPILIRKKVHFCSSLPVSFMSS
jgi:hypothetical protein